MGRLAVVTHTNSHTLLYRFVGWHDCILDGFCVILRILLGLRFILSFHCLHDHYLALSVCIMKLEVVRCVIVCTRRCMSVWMMNLWHWGMGLLLWALSHEFFRKSPQHIEYVTIRYKYSGMWPIFMSHCTSTCALRKISNAIATMVTPLSPILIQK